MNYAYEVAFEAWNATWRLTRDLSTEIDASQDCDQEAILYREDRTVVLTVHTDLLGDLGYFFHDDMKTRFTDNRDTALKWCVEFFTA